MGPACGRWRERHPARARRVRARYPPLLAAALVLPMLLAGCLAGDDRQGPDSSEALDEGGASGGRGTHYPAADGTGGAASSGADDGAGKGAGNASGDGNASADGGGDPPPGLNITDDPWAGHGEPEWPPLSEARVRPGVQIVIGMSQCTSNFLFRAITDGSLYLGTAAHCVQGQRLGDPVTIRDPERRQVMRGSIAYSSWWSIGFRPAASGLGDDVHPHDFALIEIPRDQRHLVHPAVLHYGGPTRLADWDNVSQFDRVLAYGDSGMRPDVEALHRQEGYVLEKTAAQGGHTVLTHTFAPIPGDSGSGLMTKDGAALGALSAIYAGTPYGAWWEYSSLPHALSHLEAEGWHLQLGTWRLDDNGTLP